MDKYRVKIYMMNESGFEVLLNVESSLKEKVIHVYENMGYEVTHMTSRILAKY